MAALSPACAQDELENPPLARSFITGAVGEGAHPHLRSTAGSFVDNPPKGRFDTVTILAVNIATFAYLPLQLPQIYKDTFILTRDQVKVLAWPGTVAGALGNLLLATYFAGQKEWAAVRVQIIGAATNFVVVVQIFEAGGRGLSAPIFVGLSVIMVVGLLAPSLAGLGCLTPRIFAVWKEASTVVGCGALIFSVLNTFTGDVDVVMGASGVGAALMGLLVSVRPSIFVGLLSTLSGWLATLLFMFMPIPQIYANITNPKNAASFSMGFVVLATIGNGLCVSRALFSKDRIWFTGAVWGTLGSWILALTVWRAGLLPAWVWLLYTFGLFSYFALLLRVNGAAQRESCCEQLRFVWKSC